MSGSRRAGPAIEPPEDADPRELAYEVRSQLRTLSKLNAEKVARHLVAAGRLVDDDPAAALQHARAARALGARVAVVREAVGETAYAAGEWAEAIAELRTARRMTGDDSALPMIADAERALGRADRALKIAQSEEAQALEPAERAEMRIVEAGARHDLGQLDAALLTLQDSGLDRTSTQPWSARVWYAYADLLLAAGREDEAREWFVAAAGADQDGSTDADERLLQLDGIEVLTDEDEDDEDTVDAGTLEVVEGEDGLDAAGPDAIDVEDDDALDAVGSDTVGSEVPLDAAGLDDEDDDEDDDALGSAESDGVGSEVPLDAAGLDDEDDDEDDDALGSAESDGVGSEVALDATVGLNGVEDDEDDVLDADGSDASEVEDDVLDADSGDVEGEDALDVDGGDPVDAGDDVLDAGGLDPVMSEDDAALGAGTSGTAGRAGAESGSGDDDADEGDRAAEGTSPVNGSGTEADAVQEVGSGDGISADGTSADDDEDDELEVAGGPGGDVADDDETELDEAEIDRADGGAAAGARPGNPIALTFSDQPEAGSSE